MKTITRFFALLILIWIYACKPEGFTTNFGDKLSFSEDTIVYDTILTKLYVGTPKSVNRQFVVRNPHSKRIKTSIFLAGGDQSQFRINVDGDPGTTFTDVEIGANDSIFVFVEAYANPNHNPSGNPLIVRDSIVFQTNGNFQNIQLVAWGQDCNYIYRDSTETNVVWSDKTKPYVVYDYFYVKPGTTLTIKEGVKVYFSPYATIYTEGTLKVEGTASEPVLFEGDRTSDKYSDKFSAYKYANLPGQWFGLSFAWPTKGNSINNARIKNAIFGIYCDSSSVDGQPIVDISKTFIQNMTFSAIRGTRSKIKAVNSVMANCGSVCVYTFKGGDYNLNFCTLSGFCDFGGTNDPALVVSNRLRNDFGQIIETYPITFSMINTIVWGEQKEEVYLDIEAQKLIQLTPLNNLLKSNNANFLVAGTNNVLNKNPKFKDYLKYRYDLDTLSPARGIGLTGTGITDDYLSKARDAAPDAGAFEKIE